MEPFVYDANSGLYTIPSWSERNGRLIVGFTSRHLAGLPWGNLAFHVAEDGDEVVANRKWLADLVGVEITSLTCALQPHGNKVAVIDEKLRGAGALSYKEAISDADGLITKLPDTLLTLFFADCVPLYLYDPVTGGMGLAHAGWRGTVLQIGRQMVEAMERQFGSARDALQVAIGPSIGPCCYQVDEQVMAPVRSLLPGEWHIVAKPEGDNHFRLDLRKLNQILLEKEGIRKENIEITHICTSCQSDLLFSHRKEKGKAGRMAAFIGMREGRA